jgi:hypothetical protein
MGDRRKKQKFKAKREARLEKQETENREWRIRKGLPVEETGIPRGAVVADQSQQAPNNSYSPPPTYYVDVEFKCRDCGKREVWTAKQQKWYYEVAKGPLFGTAVRCHDCRAKIRKQKELQREQMAEAARRKSESSKS